MSEIALRYLLCFLVLLGPPRAWAEVIGDPEDPGTQALSADEPDAPVDEPDSSDGWIGDPEAPPVLPMPTSTSEPAPQNASADTQSSFVQQARFRGNALSQTQVDLRREGSDEDTFELLHEASLGLRVRFSRQWSAVIEGRLSWWLTSGYASTDSPIMTDPSDWQGRVEPTLRDAYVTGRAGEWQLRLGQIPVSWGSTDFSRPADVVAPRDLRRAPFAGREEARIPVPAMDATWLHDRIAWQFLVIPFFLPNQQPLYGSDYALARQGSPVADTLPLGAINQLVDPSTEDRVNPALTQTELPEEWLRNTQLGTRFTSSYGNMDVSASWYWGYDRNPWVYISPSVREFARVLGEQPADAPLISLNAETLAVAGPLIDDINAGKTLVESSYRRYQVFALDGVRYVGPVGVRFESAFSPVRTGYLTGLTSVRRPQLTTAVGLSYEGESTVVVSLEGFYAHTFAQEDDGEWLLETDRQWGTAAALQWDLASVSRTGSAWNNASLQVASLFFPNGQDLFVFPAAVWEFERGLKIEAGVAVFASFDDDKATIGDVVDWNDSAWLRVSHVF